MMCQITPDQEKSWSVIHSAILNNCQGQARQPGRHFCGLLVVVLSQLMSLQECIGCIQLSSSDLEGLFRYSLQIAVNLLLGSEVSVKYKLVAKMLGRPTEVNNGRAHSGCVATSVHSAAQAQLQTRGTR